MSNIVKTVYVVVEGDGAVPEIYANEDTAYDRVCGMIQELAGWFNWSDEEYDEVMDEIQEARDNPTADWVGLQGVDDCGYWRRPIC